MVACRDEGHLFCVDCLKSYAENQLFGQGNLGIDKATKQPALELKCFYGGGGGGGDGCSSGFQRELLEKSLPARTLKKYDDVQCQISVGKAGLDDLCSCPKCDFQAALPPNEKVFRCPVASCGFESCRDCGEAAHVPLRCEEVEKEVETKGRLTVEEAITEAKIRRCPNPKCRQVFIKSDGCNKVRCGCGKSVCYLCRKEIKSYAHFCQTPHCQHQSCNKCPLYTKDEKDDLRAMKEAGLKAAEEQKVEVDVDSIMKEPVKNHAGAKKK